MQPEHRTLDERPGAVPEIRAVGDSVTFCLDVPTEDARLLIRRSPDGTVGAAIDFRQQVEPQR